MKEKQIYLTKHWNIIMSVVIIITGVLLTLGLYAINIHYVVSVKDTLVLSKNESCRLLFYYSIAAVIHCIIWFWFCFGYLKRKLKNKPQ
jgi:hypothetical protein